MKQASSAYHHPSWKFPTIIFTLLLALFSLQGFPEPGKAELPSAVDTYLDKYLYLARMVHAESGIPLPIILAVAGLESDWGRSELARFANNHFGIKATDWQADTYCKTTLEYDAYAVVSSIEACFRRYPLIKDSYQDFAAFLKGRPYYRGLFDYGILDYRSWAVGLQEARYGTDPEYASKLLRIIHDYRLDAVQ